MNLFFSYRFDSDEEVFSSRVFFYIGKQPSIDMFYWQVTGKPGSFMEQLRSKIELCDYFILFCGEVIGDTQLQELSLALEQNKMIIPVKFPGYQKPKPLTKKYADFIKIEEYASIVVKKKYKERIEEAAVKCAKDILRLVGLNWLPEDGLPIGYPFDYEKDIIKEFIDGHGKLSPKRIKQGCPREWPRVDRKIGRIENPVSIETIGAYGDWDGKNKKDPQVIPAALSEYHPLDGHNCLTRLGLTFPEARPRKFLYYPRNNGQLKVGIVVSGGIAPGINSVIAGIVKRHVLYHNAANQQHGALNIIGYLEGFKSFLRNFDGPRHKVIYSSANPMHLHSSHLENTVYTKAEDGGSIIPTSRADDLLKETYRSQHFSDVVDLLLFDHVDILYVIGGDGSMKAAHAISNFAGKKKSDLAVVGIPKTMDNDILWVWQSFGFLSAVEWAKGAIRQIYTEVTSNPRICIIQLFGSDSGFVVTHAALASGVCDLVLIPEHPFNTEKVVEYILTRLKSRYVPGQEGRSPYGIVLLAETALPTDASKAEIMQNAGLSVKEIEAVNKFVFFDNRRVKGQTPDELRSAGVKIILKSLQDALKRQDDDYWHHFRVFTNEPRHLIRSIPPSSSDIIFGERLGSLAVDGAMAGYRDFMISQWLTEYVMIPLELVVLGRKRIPKEGIFWKSVRSTTGQPQSLIDKEEDTKERKKFDSSKEE